MRATNRLRWVSAVLTLGMLLAGDTARGRNGHPYLGQPADGSRILDLIEAACDGDTVWLEDGTYSLEAGEALSFAGKGIVVASLSASPASCVIEGHGDGSVVECTDGETHNSVLMGVTIRGGKTSGAGGGVRCIASSPRLVNCIIEDNHGVGGGGVACLGKSSIVLEWCTIRANRCGEGQIPGWGAGVYIAGGATATLIECTIEDNLAGGMGGGIKCDVGEALLYRCSVMRNIPEGLAVELGTAYLEDCIVAGNEGIFGGGVYVFGGQLELVGCTVSGNRSQTNGGGMTVRDGSHARVVDTIVWGNCADGRAPEMMVGVGGIATIGCSAVDTTRCEIGGELQFEDGILIADPRFCYPEDCSLGPVVWTSYGVAADSPCLPRNGGVLKPIGAVHEPRCESIPAPTKVSWGNLRAIMR